MHRLPTDRIVLILVCTCALVVGACAAAAPPTGGAEPSASGTVPMASPSWDVAGGSPRPTPSPGATQSPIATASPTAGIAWSQVVGGSDVLLMDAVAFPGGVAVVGGARGWDRAPSPGLATSGIAGPGSCKSRWESWTCAGPVAWVAGLDGGRAGVGPIGADGGALHHLTWSGSSLVALGCLGQPETEGADCARPIVWTSPDGTTWAPATVPRVPDGATGIILRDVAAVGGEVIVAGCTTARDPETFGALCTAAAAWRSTDDGRTWGPLELPDGPDAVTQVMTLATDGATVVAGGFAAQPWEERIWVSTDGADWVRVAADPAGTDTVEHVARVDGSWLALGRTDEATAVWRSTDGRTWDLAVAAPARLRIGEVLALPDGLVALGSRDNIPVVATSRDGLAWTLAASGFVLQDPEMAALGDRIVAVGREGAWLSDAITPAIDIP